MDISQSFNSLHAYLNSRLVDLQLNEKGHIVLKDTISPSIDPQMTGKVKDQFHRLILSNDIIDETDIIKEIAFLQRRKSQLKFLKYLSNSTLLNEIFTNEEFSKVVYCKRQIYKKGLDLSFRNFIILSQTGTSDKKELIEELRYKLIKLNEVPFITEHQINLLIRELELKTELIKKIPGIDKTLSSLSDEDQNLFFSACAKTTHAPSQKDLDIYIALCKRINDIKDDELKKNLKNYVFSIYAQNITNIWFGQFQDLVDLSIMENQLKDFFSTFTRMSKGSESQIDKLMSWIVELLKDKSIQRLKPSEKINELKSGFLILERCSKALFIPRPSKIVSVLKQLELNLKNPELYKALVEIEDFDHLMRCAILLPEEFSVLPPIFLKNSKNKLNLFVNIFKLLNIGQQRQILHGLTQVSLDYQDEVFDQIIILFTHIPYYFRHIIEPLFMHKNLLSALHELNTVLEENLLEEDVLKNALKTKNATLYKNLFEELEDSTYWNGCVKKFNNNYSHLTLAFNQWINEISLDDRKIEEPWEEYIQRTRPSFQVTLSSLFRIEKNNAELFEKILRVSLKDNSSRTLVSIIQLYRYTDDSNFETFLKALENEPILIPFVSKIFPSQSIDYLLDDPSLFFLQMNYLESKTLSFMLKEGSKQHKLLDMIVTNDNNPNLFEKIIQYETTSNTPSIWQSHTTNAYSNLQEKHLNILIKRPSILDSFIKNGFKEIPWEQIPDEIWEIDLELPLKLLILCREHKITLSIRTLLVGVISNKKDSLAYKLFKLNEDGHLNDSALRLMLEAPSGDYYANALAAICLKDNTRVAKTLPILKNKEWQPFTSVVERLEDEYLLDGYTVEEKLQNLPIKWRWTIAKLIIIGLKNIDLIKPLSDLVVAHPQAPFIESLLDAFNNIFQHNPKLSEKKRFIELFTNIPSKKMRLSKDFKERNEDGSCGNAVKLYRIITEYSKKFKEKDPSILLEHLLPLSSQSINFALTVINDKQDHFLSMIDLDLKFGPPYGKVIQSGFTEERQKLLLNDPDFFHRALQYNDLGFITKRGYESFGMLYLKLIEICGSMEGILQILEHSACIESLKKVNLQQLTHPNRFLNRILTLASWDQVDAVTKLLNWFQNNSYTRAEGLLDMAVAGYIPEVLEIITALEKNPLDQKYSLLLEKADSYHALEIQTELSGLTKLSTIKTMKSKVDANLTAQVKSRMKSFIKATLKDVTNPIFKERAIETELCMAIATSMLGQGELIFLPFNDIDKLFKKLQIPKDSDFAINLLKNLSYVKSDSRFSEFLFQIKITTDQSSPIFQIIKRMHYLTRNEVINEKHAQVAVLSASISRTRQEDGVDSCFGTGPSIVTQSDKEGLLYSLKDLQSLLLDSALTRQISGKHAGSYTFPCSLMQKKLNMPILYENLLLKARETAITGMGSIQQGVSNVSNGLLSENLNLFDEHSFYDQCIESFNQTTLFSNAPIQPKVILEALRKSFITLAKAVTENEDEHPISKKKGWIHLARRDKNQNISNLVEYQNLHHDVILKAYAALSQMKEYKSFQKYLLNLFKELTEISQNEDMYSHFSDGKIEIKEKNLWRTSSGGNSEYVMSTYFNFVDGIIPRNQFFTQNPEQTLKWLLHTFEAFPEIEKESYLKEPEKSTYVGIPSHALCLRPYSFIKHLEEGKTAQDLLDKLMKPSQIHLSKFSKETKQVWKDFFIEKAIPVFSQKPFEMALSSIKWGDMSLEECGKAIMETFFDIHKLEPGIKIKSLLESCFLKLLEPEMLQSIPIQIIGDLNWNKLGYNNYYLGCARSPLTGELTWYSCSRDGTDRYAIFWNISGWWEILSPINRKENGFLSYRSLKI